MTGIWFTDLSSKKKSILRLQTSIYYTFDDLQTFKSITPFNTDTFLSYNWFITESSIFNIKAFIMKERLHYECRVKDRPKLLTSEWMVDWSFKSFTGKKNMVRKQLINSKLIAFNWTIKYSILLAVLLQLAYASDKKKWVLLQFFYMTK